MGEVFCAVFLCAVFLISAFSLSALGCTTFGITKSASADGSVIVAHSNDGFGPGEVGTEIREDAVVFSYVPAQDFAPGSKRPVLYDPNSGGEFRGSGESSDNDSIIIGYIDQANHTYSYISGSYGMINEHQLISGECTDFARVHPDAEKGKRIFYSSDLSNIAMERCRTAREAVALVGSLIDRYGYYGTGETLIFGDPKEVWVIEMCGGTPSGTGGYWVAERVPEGQVFVAANEFRIREIDANSSNNSDLMFSANLFDDAEAMGWWNRSQGKLDWTATFSAGEYSHPYYSLGRVWRILDRIAPSMNLSANVEGPFTTAYPVFVVPDRKINLTEAFDLYRDHYEGTEFDLTAPPAGGPFGDPYRKWGPFDEHDRLYPGELKPGAWPRPISTDPCGYSYVAQARDWLPDSIGGVCWLGLSSPSETCYAPFYSGITGLPEPYLNGSHWNLDFNTAFWPFEIVQNWARLMYGEMIPVIKAEQAKIEGGELSRQADIEQQALDLHKKDELSARQFLTDYTNATAMENLKSWMALFERLVITYRNGQYNDIQNKTITNIGYPDWWLEKTGYQYGPRVYDVQALREIPDVIYAKKTVNITTSDPIAYIRENQTKKI
ncbi:MAG: Peptidase family C69 [Methanosaeta sp. PtaU1.Bin112]|nr:MAG: Peptidase family C69 [Methanosaeta sp. PtaU1.Bin112]